jgi:hypothetical protein
MDWFAASEKDGTNRNPVACGVLDQVVGNVRSVDVRQDQKIGFALQG